MLLQDTELCDLIKALTDQGQTIQEGQHAPVFSQMRIIPIPEGK